MKGYMYSFSPEFTTTSLAIGISLLAQNRGSKSEIFFAWYRKWGLVSNGFGFFGGGGFGNCISQSLTSIAFSRPGSRPFHTKLQCQRNIGSELCHQGHHPWVHTHHRTQNAGEHQTRIPKRSVSVNGQC